MLRDLFTQPLHKRNPPNLTATTTYLPTSGFLAQFASRNFKTLSEKLGFVFLSLKHLLLLLFIRKTRAVICDFMVTFDTRARTLLTPSVGATFIFTQYANAHTWWRLAATRRRGEEESARVCRKKRKKFRIVIVVWWCGEFLMVVEFFFCFGMGWVFLTCVDHQNLGYCFFFFFVVFDAVINVGDRTGFFFNYWRLVGEKRWTVCWIKGQKCWKLLLDWLLFV